MNARAVLRTLPGISRLSDSELDAIEFAMREERLPGGAALATRRGAWTFAVVLSGTVRGPKGERIGTGEVLWSRRRASWRAVGEVRLARLDRGALAILIGSRSPLAAAFRDLISSAEVRQLLVPPSAPAFAPRAVARLAHRTGHSGEFSLAVG